MFHCSVLVATNYYRCIGDCQCMVYAQAHLQAILLPRSTFSSNPHCSADEKLILQNYFISKYFSFYISVQENRPPTSPGHQYVAYKTPQILFFAQRNFKFETRPEQFAAASHECKSNQTAQYKILTIWYQKVCMSFTCKSKFHQVNENLINFILFLHRTGEKAATDRTSYYLKNLVGYRTVAEEGYHALYTLVSSFLIMVLRALNGVK